MARITPEETTTEFNRIIAGTTIKGDIQATGDFRIDGTLVGTINVKGKIVLGPTGRIEGEVQCKNAEVQGSINANIKVDELLSLKASAKLQGEIMTNKIAIEPGARISGNINMDKQAGILKVSQTEENGNQRKEAAV